jgi:hypothetical protein
MVTDIQDDAPPVRRRRVFYLPGYDPRPPSTYRDLFAHELAKAARLRHYSAEAGPLDETDPIAPSFAIHASFDGAPVETHISILRWDDLVRPAYKLPLLSRLPRLLHVGLDLLRRGVIARVARLDWQFAVFLAYPYVMTLLAIMLVAVTALWAGTVVSEALPIAALPAAMVAAGFAAWFWLRIERALYLRYLLEDWFFSFAHERGESDSLAERVDAFADRIVEAATDPETDELLLIGHSSGSFLAPETLARALDLNPKPGEGRVTVSLLTIGALASLFLCDSRTSRFAAALSRLAEEPGLAWYEVQSRHDVMNMCPVDPVAVSGQFPDREPPWPRILRLSMPQITAPGQLTLFRERLWFFPNHFRFIAANEQVDWYDFYGVVAGPKTLAARFGGLMPTFRKVGEIGTR